MLCIFGDVVNAPLVLAAARGLIIAQNHALLADYSGNLNPDKQWAQSLCMGFVQRKPAGAQRLESAICMAIGLSVLKKLLRSGHMLIFCY